MTTEAAVPATVVKPSEIAPGAYLAWAREQGVDPETLRET